MTVGGAYACSALSRKGPDDAIKSCYANERVLPTPENPNAKTLKVPVAEGIAEGDPVNIDESITDRVARAIVEINAPDWKGTGFIVTDPEGHQVVITAAHVDGGLPFNQLTITTNDGRTVTPTGGCYMYNNPGETLAQTVQSGSEADNPNYQDIAVLTLSAPLTDQPLKIATREPASGKWIFFENYQAFYGPNNSPNQGDIYQGPVTYTGIVTPRSAGSPFPSDIDVITGANDIYGSNMTEDEFDSTHLVGGASGGPMLAIYNGQPYVVGESAAGTEDGAYLGQDGLSSYTIQFPGADNSADTGFRPTAAVVMPRTLIEWVLHAPVLTSSK